jgi:membrane protein implicated in regulation of membrane protease activity
MDSILNFLLALATDRTLFTLTPPLFWLTAGIVLSAIDLLILKTLPRRYRFYLLMMGVAALICSSALWIGSIVFQFNWAYVMYAAFDWHISYWMVISLALNTWIRPLLIVRKKFVIPAATTATTISEILPGEMGMVMYEGAPWKARNEDFQGIAAKQKVYVLHREGNTLIVIPDRLIHING